jgi:NAD(P)-dependent dehydrogenase (short-subunit alcohol dehydrogenase family)
MNHNGIVVGAGGLLGQAIVEILNDRSAQIILADQICPPGLDSIIKESQN